MSDRTLTPQELASEAFLNVKVSTLYSHMSRGDDLPPSFKIGSQTRWRESDVLKWIEQKKTKKARANFEK